MRLWLLGIVWWTGCVMENVVPLDELRPRLHFYGTHEAMLMDLEFDEQNLPSCGVFATSFRATINGSPLDVQLPWVSPDQYCLRSPIQFRHENPPTTPAVVEISDDSLTITADVGDRYAPRTVTVPAGDTLQSGTIVKLGWSHPGDLTHYTPRIGLADYDDAMPTDGSPSQQWWTDAAGIDSEYITFELPASTISSGEVVLEVAMANDRATLPCSNTTCTQTIGLRASHEVVLE